MDDFLGEFQQVMDAKNRIFIPAKFRDILSNGLVVTRHFDSCLAVYSKEGWAMFTGKLSSFPTSKSIRINRFIYAKALDVKPDTQGRIVLTQALRDHAALIKDIYIVGVGDHLEIWDKDKYIKSMEELTGESVLNDISSGADNTGG